MSCVRRARSLLVSQQHTGAHKFTQHTSIDQSPTTTYPTRLPLTNAPRPLPSPQRRAVLDAAHIAGVKCLRLMNETAATALNWGLPKSIDFPEDPAPPKHVLFYDMGYTSTQCCIVAYTKTKMTVLASTFDRELGGKDFDDAMTKYFADEWFEKKKLDLYSAPKSVYRLQAQVDKIKQQLSGYTSQTKLPCNVECMQDDQDFASFIDTETWVNITKDLIERSLEPVKAIVRDTKLTFDQIEEVEVVGSATRSPLITNALAEFLGKEPKRTMNSEEAVSKGCALKAAMLSPNFRVRDFDIVDCTPYAVALTYPTGADSMEVEGSGKNNTVFTQYNIVPSTKLLTFHRSAAFDITASYAELSQLAPGTPAQIGTFTVTEVKNAADGGTSKVKVKVRIDANGIFSVDSAHAAEEVVEMEVDAPAGGAATADGEGKGEEAAAAPAGDAKDTKDAKGEEPKKEGKKKVKKTDLPVKGKPSFSLTSAELDVFKNAEYEMSVQDRHIKELQEKKNDLEAYIYSMRDRCSESGDLGKFISPESRAKFMPMLDEMENWLYEDEAETANKSTFVTKLDSLKAFGQPAVSRCKENDERPIALAELQATIREYTDFVASTDPAYAHITPEERSKAQGYVAEVADWVAAKTAQQSGRQMYDDLAVTCQEIKTKRTNLIYDCNVIRNKTKPTPPAAPKAEEKPKADANNDKATPPEGAPPAEEVPLAGEAMDEGLD